MKTIILIISVLVANGIFASSFKAGCRQVAVIVKKPVRVSKKRPRSIIIGTRVPFRPVNSVAFYFNGIPYLFAAGVFYKECDNSEYEVIKPEIGMIVPQLPEYNVEQVTFKNETLFLFDGTLYKQIPTPEGVKYKVTGFIE